MRFQENVWGKQGSESALDAQRSDLWSINMVNVVEGVKQISTMEIGTLEPYYARSVVLPEMKMKPESVRRDSRSYMMPGFDEALDSIKITFLMDACAYRTESKIYRLLTLWRKLVRAGRGPMSSEMSIDLNDNYQLPYAFSIPVTLLRGTELKATAITSASLLPPFASTRQKVDDQGLTISQQLTLENAWLCGFKLSELSYATGNQITTIDATIYATDILGYGDTQITSPYPTH